MHALKLILNDILILFSFQLLLLLFELLECLFALRRVFHLGVPTPDKTRDDPEFFSSSINCFMGTNRLPPKLTWHCYTGNGMIW